MNWQILNQPHPIITRLVTVTVAITTALTLAGCVIPTPDHGLLSERGEIGPDKIKQLVVGRTIRGDVLRLLGQPDNRYDGGRIFAYYWVVTQGYAAFGGGTVAYVGPIPKSYLVMVQFDAGGRLVKAESFAAGILVHPENAAEEWAVKHHRDSFEGKFKAYIDDKKRAGFAASNNKFVSFEKSFTPRPGLRFREIRVSGFAPSDLRGGNSNFNTADELRKQLNTVFGKEGLLAPSHAPGRRLTLNARILGYDSGSTDPRLHTLRDAKLAVECKVLDGGRPVGTVRVMGKTFPTSPRPEVFQKVSKEIARELKKKLKTSGKGSGGEKWQIGADIMVTLTAPPAVKGRNAWSKLPSMSMRTPWIVDRRTDKVRLGEFDVIFVKIGNVLLTGDPGEPIRNALVDAWRSAGHRISWSGPQLTVTIHRVAIDFKINLLDFDSVATMEIEISRPGWSRRYTTQRKKKTLLQPSEKELSKLLSDCLAGFVAEAVSDDRLATSLRSSMR